MEAVVDDFSRFSLQEIAGNKIELLNKIQEQIHSVILALSSGRDLLLVKNNVQCTLERIYKNLGVLKASFRDEGIVMNLATLKLCEAISYRLDSVVFSVFSNTGSKRDILC